MSWLLAAGTGGVDSYPYWQPPGEWPVSRDERWIPVIVAGLLFVAWWAGVLVRRKG